MAKLVVTDRQGVVTTLEVAVGQSLMEAIREGGIDDIQAVCGGCASCATCHVYVDTSQTSLLPEMSVQESELLDSSSHSLPNSRLSCQIPISEALNWLSVRIAPED